MTTPFHDLGDYLDIPRVNGLRLSPDGTWLAASVAMVSADRKKMLSSIWRIDPAGGPPRRLTRSAEGEGSPRFLPDGSLLFISKRPDPDGDESGSGAKPALWLLPAGGGEARVVASLPGGVSAVETGAGGGIVVVGPVLDATRAVGDGAASDGGPADGGTTQADARLREARADAGVSAVLHESGIVRFWDADLGPDDLRLFAVTADPEAEARAARPDPRRDARVHRAHLRGQPGRRVGRHQLDLVAGRPLSHRPCAD